MSSRGLSSVKQPPEQMRYALVLQWGARAGLAMLIASTLALAMGWGEPLMPLRDLALIWSDSSQAYRASAAAASQMAWLDRIMRPDGLAIAGIGMLAGISAISLLSVIPVMWRSHHRWLVAICVALMAVLLLAAVGVVSPEH